MVTIMRIHERLQECDGIVCRGKFMSSNKKPGSEEKKNHEYMIYDGLSYHETCVAAGDFGDICDSNLR